MGVTFKQCQGLLHRGMKSFQVFSCFFSLLLSLSSGNKILEIQVKTSTDTDAGMNGGLMAEICDSQLNCCTTGELDSPRDDFNKGFVDVFYGSDIGLCDHFEVLSDSFLVILTHNGSDAWKGEYVRIILDGGIYRSCPMDTFLDDFQTVTLNCA